MAHLYRFRKGWENENLAQYLLSRFSFVARPISVADDVGTDFYCTLFQKKNEKKKKTKTETLIPRTSFAIQVKSHRDIAPKKNRINITNKVGYLKSLEIPFFIGVVNSEKNTITIYSGELLPRFFSFRGNPTRLRAVLCERRKYEDKAAADNKYDLDFPCVAELSVDIGDEELSAFVKDFLKLCLLMRTNLSARTNKQYIFETPLPGRKMDLVAYAGRNSAKTIKGSFIKRLAEIFINLRWLLKYKPDEFDMDEFLVYERLYLDLKRLGYPPNDFVEKHYKKLRHALNGVDTT